ncbi:MAG: PAS domain S-box protein [bacterium]
MNAPFPSDDAAHPASAQRAPESRASESRYHVILDSLREGCQLIGFDWRYLYLNEAAATHNRRPNDELLGRTMAEVWPHLGTSQAYALLQRCMDERVAMHEEIEFVYPDGTTRWFDVRTQPVPEGIFALSIDVTERRNAEAARRVAESRYRRLFDSNIVGVMIADLRGHIKEANDYLLGIIGYTRAELESGATRWDTITPPQWRAVDEHIVREILDSGACAPIEKEYLRRDGRVVPVLVSVARLDGTLDDCICLVEDLSEHKEFDRRIQHLNRVYAVLSDINQTIVREKDPQAVLDAACRIALERGGFLMTWIGLFENASGRIRIRAHAGADAATLGILSLLIESDPPAGCLFTQHAVTAGEHGVCNDIAGDEGAASWRAAALERGYLAMASLPLKAGGQVIGAFNIYAGEEDFFNAEELRVLDELAIDISFALEVQSRDLARAQADEHRRVAEDRFRQLAENIQEVFWMTDMTKNEMLYISPAYEAIWGRTCASVYESPTSWMDAVHPDDRARVMLAATTKQVLGQYDEVYRVIRPEGSVRWIRDRAFPIRDEHGVVHRMVGTAMDITEQRQLEEQFRQSQKMEAVGQLAGGVAHDFNNILSAMMMQAELAGMEPNLPLETRELLLDIKAAAERAAKLTRQLLTFSRRQVLQPRPVDLNEVVTSLTKMLQRILGEDVSLTLNLHSRTLMTRADAGMLDQLLMNLVVNARDAMPDGGRLTIETGERELTDEDAHLIPDATPGPHVWFSVTDTGTGISAEHLSHIFEPFFTTKEAGKGTGLGLATAFGIVKQHDGVLQVDSAMGAGTTFRILLPAQPLSEATAELEATRHVPRGGTETILVVEDEPNLRALTRIVLERHGYHVLEAEHGVQALRVWEEYTHPIHLLLTDIVMPEGISGRELADRLRQQNPELRIIFTTGYSAEIAGRELKLQPGQNFIQKPSAPMDLLETVRRSLDS